jgi:hypothetical protein
MNFRPHPRQEAEVMFDEFQRLREDYQLFRLLTHYVQGNTVDREIWQDRLMQLDGARPDDLVKLHGELLAYEWIDQNTGNLKDARPGAVPRCYRASAAGRRALAQASTEEAQAA